MKTRSAKHEFTSAVEIAEKIVVRLPDSVNALPSVRNLAKAANRHRQKNRPRHPTELSTDLCRDSIPDGFLRDDISVGHERHLLFATDAMIALLSKAKTWYIDGTFKVIRQPFQQLLSVHAFVVHEGVAKQFPLAFVVMSSRRKKDYVAVLRSLLNLLPTNSVRQIVSDFEAALWRAVKNVLPGVTHRGCAFHWGQAVFRHIQSVGLQSAYSRDESVRCLCRQLLALPFIPAWEIPDQFAKIETKANSFCQKLAAVVEYVRSTWIDSSLWMPTAWSVYKQPVRTNNDVEGWHYRLNNKARRASLNLYQLIQLLHHEALVVVISVRALSNHKLKQYQRHQYSDCSARLHKYWTEHEEGKRSCRRLLKRCAGLYNPPELRK